MSGRRLIGIAVIATLALTAVIAHVLHAQFVITVRNRVCLDLSLNDITIDEIDIGEVDIGTLTVTVFGDEGDTIAFTVTVELVGVTPSSSLKWFAIKI